MSPFIRSLFFALTLIMSTTLLGVKERDKSPAPDESAVKKPVTTGTKKSMDASSSSTKPSLLWNSWYVMTVNGKIPFGYYNDRVERKDGKIAYQNQLWKKEEGFVNEERVVSFGQDDEKLTPLLFNFLATYRNTELSIDGTFSGTTLTVKARKNKQNLDPIQTNVQSKAFLSTLFQVWIGKHLASFKAGKATSFVTIFEDGLDNHYAAIYGSITLEATDEFAKKSDTQKLSIELDSVKSTWYVLASGEAVRIEKPDQHLLIEKKTEAEARRFLVKRTDAE